ncbi:MAG: UDP-N-acetylmuramate--L-alanine ligase [Clostridiales bacterium 38-18]|nr:MAG: UDP-N-acetylmuramate--L-alanine ligase [Clostridiales bacterium 38-18]
MIDLSQVKHIHIVGIGGISNSAIAEILLEQGYQVSGSDLNRTSITDHLVEKGVKITYAHLAENVEGSELVVYTAAVAEDNPELVEASRIGIPCISRAEMLGQIMAGYGKSIAISGTHGKTTTTSMLTRIFNDPTLDPTALVGGYFTDIKSNVKIGKSDYFITEACEYKESFLSFYPKVGIILNIDEDHLDYFHNLDQIVSAFVKFAHNIDDDGTLVLNGDDYNSRKIIPYYKGKIITFGLADHCDIIARNITYNGLGYPTFEVFSRDEKLCKLTLSVPGQHNIYNALAAFAASRIYIKDIQVIASRLSSFKNANRRFEWIGKQNDVLIIDDYAHHPSAIKVTLEAATRMEDVNRILCIFQPHTYSRTKELLNEFASSFSLAEEVILCDIYAAREVDHGEVSSLDLLKALKKEGVSAVHFSDFDEIVKYVVNYAVPGDMILTVGAGDVYKLAPKILEALKKTQ